MRPVFKRQNDLQRVHPAGQCTRCGEELYPACYCWRIGGAVLCEACAVEWIREELIPFRMRYEEVER